MAMFMNRMKTASYLSCSFAGGRAVASRVLSDTLVGNALVCGNAASEMSNPSSCVSAGSSPARVQRQAPVPVASSVMRASDGGSRCRISR